MEFDLNKPYCRYFSEICAIPHGSYHEKAVSDYVVAFAKEHGLECVQDKMFNVIIRKSASKGYEEYDPLMLQGHLDMVCDSCQKITVMCNKYNRFGYTGKVLFQPYDHILIQMVGRFIQQV